MSGRHVIFGVSGSIGSAVARELGQEPKIRVANGMLLNVLALFSGDMHRLKKGKVYQFTTPWLVDSSRSERAFGSEVIPIRDAVRETVAWYKDHRRA